MMRLEMTVGGRTYTVIAGPHEGETMRKGVLRVFGPGIVGYADIEGAPVVAGAEARCAWAISRAVNNIALPNLLNALQRADRLVEHMSGYLGQMAPGSYTGLYSDLNEHGLFMANAGVGD